MGVILLLMSMNIRIHIAVRKNPNTVSSDTYPSDNTPFNRNAIQSAHMPKNIGDGFKRLCIYVIAYADKQSKNGRNDLAVYFRAHEVIRFIAKF